MEGYGSESQRESTIDGEIDESNPKSESETLQVRKNSQNFSTGSQGHSDALAPKKRGSKSGLMAGIKGIISSLSGKSQSSSRKGNLVEP